MWHDILFRIRALFRGARLDHQMEDELRYHLEREISRNLARGLSPEEAERQARWAIGPVTQIREDCREARGLAWVESTLQDARYAVRMLRKTPGFTLAVVLSLALGIGANTAIFSLMNAVMWRSLPVRQPEELQLLGRADREETSYGFIHTEFRRLREHNRSFTDLAAYGSTRLNVSIDGSVEPAAEGQLVTGAYFSLLGVPAAAGRSISEEDDRIPNGHPVAMISHGYWKRRFGLARDAIGRTISISGTPFTVVGVTPPEFFGMEVGAAPDLFVPVMMQPAVMPATENWLDESINRANWLRVFGRLKPGVRPQEASALIAAVVNSLSADQPPKKGGPYTAFLSPADRGLSDLRRQFSQPLYILIAVTGLVLLIACANTANLLIARAAARRMEWTMRLALGAGRWRLTRQLLVESIALAMLGGVCGLLLARWATGLLVTFMSSGRSPIALDLHPDVRILAFTAAVSILTGVLFGIAPALRASRTGDRSSVGSGVRSRTAARHMFRPGRILAVVQVALSLVLVVGAGLFVRSLQSLNSQDAGFPRDTLLTVRVEPKGSDQRGVPGASVRLDRIYRDLAERVAAVPGVRTATLAQYAPTNRIGLSSPLRLESGEAAQVQRLMVYPGYFATLGIPLIAGRDLGPGDLGEHSPLVAVVNEAFARRFFRGANPIGRRYFTRPPRSYFTTPPADFNVSCEVIGLVRDSRYANLRAETAPVIYQPFLQSNTGRGQMVLHVRTGGNPSPLIPLVRQEIQEIDRNMPALEVRTLAVEMDAALVQERLLATLSGLFGALALLLACVGLYGLLAFASVQRTGEIGIRMALGARGGDVMWMILRDALLLTAAGVAIGVPAAIGVARLASSWISGLLFGLSATDPLTLGAAAAVLLMAGVLAAWLPAWRASRVDPATALRAE